MVRVTSLGDCQLRLKNGDYLSQRQTQVLQGVLKGETAREIGAQLYISPKTVANYTDQLKDVFDCSKKRELIDSVLSQGLYVPLMSAKSMGIDLSNSGKV